MANAKMQPSRHFMAATIQRCRWLPCPASDRGSEGEGEAQGMPAALAVWSEDAQVGWVFGGPEIVEA